MTAVTALLSVYLIPLIYGYFKGVEIDIPIAFVNAKQSLLSGTIILTTRSAFIADEVINVKVIINVADDSLAKLLAKSHNFWVSFPRSKDPSKDNVVNALLYENTGFKYFNGTIYLHAKDGHLFQGKGRIEYLRPGEFGYDLASVGQQTYFLGSSKTGIKIGSTTDTLKKRREDILVFLGIAYYLLVIYFGLIR
jgi:hypothetical protein